MKILLLLARGVEVTELSAFVDVFGWDRHYHQGDVTVDTCAFTKEVTSAFNVTIGVDRLLDQVDVADYDALAIPGGFEEWGFYEDAYQPQFLALIRQFHEAGKWVATICVGALPLAKSGVLVGKKGTTYHLRGGRRQKQLAELGVTVVNQPVVMDGRLITSWCPSTAVEVALQLLAALRSPAASQAVRELMGYC